MKTDLISRSELFNKLATVPIKAESVETSTKIYEIINSMQTESVDIAESVVEQICDKYCKFPHIVESDNELDRICDNCPLDELASARIESGSDLISRADAIDAVAEMWMQLDYVDDDKESLIRELAEELFKDIPSASVEVGEWIPCSERLPKHDVWVIVTILDESGDTPFKYTDLGWYLEEASCWIVDAEQTTDVIAWMPLPEPYKGGDDE